MSADRCFASVMLDEQLWRSLAAIGGEQPVPWVHGCMLERGHGGDHRALAYRAGVQTYWVQWDGTRKARLNTAVDSGPPGPNAWPRFEPPKQPRQAAPPTTANATPTADRLDSPKSTSRDDALWAVAAALERLADIIAAAFDSPQDRGRHGR